MEARKPASTIRLQTWSLSRASRSRMRPPPQQPPSALPSVPRPPLRPAPPAQHAATLELSPAAPAPQPPAQHSAPPPAHTCRMRRASASPMAPSRGAASRSTTSRSNSGWPCINQINISEWPCTRTQVAGGRGTRTRPLQLEMRRQALPPEVHVLALPQPRILLGTPWPGQPQPRAWMHSTWAPTAYISTKQRSEEASRLAPAGTSSTYSAGIAWARQGLQPTPA